MPFATRGFVALALAALVIGLAVPAAASGLVPSENYATSVAHAVKTAPVSIHFKPKSITAAPGSTVTVRASVHNTGSFAFVATSCELWYRIGGSGSWIHAASCLKASDFPHTFSAHSKQKFSGSEKVSLTFPAGVYQWKILVVGTYNGVTEDSHSGTISVTIT